MVGNKGQVSVYVILGIVVLLGIGMFMLNINDRAKQTITLGQNTISFSSTQTNVISYMGQCLKDAYKAAKEETGLTAETKAEFEDIIKGSMEKCSLELRQIYEAQGFTVNAEDINVSAEFNENSVIVDVRYPHEFSKETATESAKFNYQGSLETFPRVIFEDIPGGIVLQDTQIISEDGRAVLNLPAGTKITDEDGKPVGRLLLKEIDRTDNGMVNNNLVGETIYNILPDGLSFSQPVLLSMSFSPGAVPDATTANNVLIGWLMEGPNVWMMQETSVEKKGDNYVASTPITHATKYGVQGGSCGSNFSVSVREPFDVIFNSYQNTNMADYKLLGAVSEEIDGCNVNPQPGKLIAKPITCKDSKLIQPTPILDAATIKNVIRPTGCEETGAAVSPSEIGVKLKGYNYYICAGGKITDKATPHEVEYTKDGNSCIWNVGEDGKTAIGFKKDPQDILDFLDSIVVANIKGNIECSPGDVCSSKEGFKVSDNGNLVAYLKELSVENGKLDLKAEAKYHFDITLSTGENIRLCFVAGTKISTPYGDKNIEDLKVGDLVYSYDHETQKIEAQPIVKYFVRETPRLMEIALENGKKIEATPEHRFFDGNSYKAIEEFKAGDSVYLLGDKLEPVKITSLTFKKVEGVTVYNFKVAKNSNYFAGGVLVHNDEYGQCPGLLNPNLADCKGNKALEKKCHDRECGGATFGLTNMAGVAELCCKCGGDNTCFINCIENPQGGCRVSLPDTMRDLEDDFANSFLWIEEAVNNAAWSLQGGSPDYFCKKEENCGNPPDCLCYRTCFNRYASDIKNTCWNGMLKNEGDVCGPPLKEGFRREKCINYNEGEENKYPKCSFVVEKYTSCKKSYGSMSPLFDKCQDLNGDYLTCNGASKEFVSAIITYETGNVIKRKYSNIPADCNVCSKALDELKKVTLLPKPTDYTCGTVHGKAISVIRQADGPGIKNIVVMDEGGVCHQCHQLVAIDLPEFYHWNQVSCDNPELAPTKSLWNYFCKTCVVKVDESNFQLLDNKDKCEMDYMTINSVNQNLIRYNLVTTLSSKSKMYGSYCLPAECCGEAKQSIPDYPYLWSGENLGNSLCGENPLAMQDYDEVVLYTGSEGYTSIGQIYRDPNSKTFKNSFLPGSVVRENKANQCYICMITNVNGGIMYSWEKWSASARPDDTKLKAVCP